MSRRYSMSTTGLAELVEILGDANDRIVAELAALDRSVATLREQWSGSAQQAYEKAHTDWTAQIEHYSGVLDEASQSVDRTVARHLEARARVAALWSPR